MAALDSPVKPQNDDPHPRHARAGGHPGGAEQRRWLAPDSPVKPENDCEGGIVVSFSLSRPASSSSSSFEKPKPDYMTITATVPLHAADNEKRVDGQLAKVIGKSETVSFAGVTVKKLFLRLDQRFR